MMVDTKQLYFVFILITLKINASIANETNEISSLGREVLSSSLDTLSPNIGILDTPRMVSTVHSRFKKDFGSEPNLS